MADTFMKSKNQRSTSWFLLVCVMADKAKVKTKLYVETLLSRLTEDCKSLLPFGFISTMFCECKRLLFRPRTETSLGSTNPY